MIRTELVAVCVFFFFFFLLFFFEAEDGIRYLVRSRGLGDVYKRQDQIWFCEKDSKQATRLYPLTDFSPKKGRENLEANYLAGRYGACLLYTSDAADERSSVDLGGRRIIKKNKTKKKKNNSKDMKQTTNRLRKESTAHVRVHQIQ